jgi:multisubunit Na+/H+ antiporter MnhC subunit
MNLKRILSITITLLLVIGIYGAGSLVWNEIQTGTGCPKIWIIPVCVIVFVCFSIPLIMHLIKKYIALYFVFTGLALAIAIIASIMQYTGNGECPKLENGTPMCYLSLLLFVSLILLKKLQIRQPKTI